jgi:CBS domain-containing protein
LLMHERRLTMVPVVADGLLVGVVRRNDILGILYRPQDGI